MLDFKGTLLTDGAAAYAHYAIEHEDVVHAQCWAHTRRQFERALSDDPPGAHAALELIGQLYTVEATIRKQQMEAVATQATRGLHALPAVDAFFAWLHGQRQRLDLAVDPIDWTAERRS